VTASTILSIISAVFAVARWLIGYAEQQKWMAAGAAEAALKGLRKPMLRYQLPTKPALTCAIISLVP
jgi:hypothetical protein